MVTVESTAAEAPWRAALQGLDVESGDGTTRRGAGNVSFGLDNGWGRFETRRSTHGDVLSNQLGRPALWKLRSGDDGSGTRSVFEIPPTVLPGPGSAAERYEALARWALSTANGKPDGSWEPPARDEIERRLPELALTLQVGSIAVQGTMTHEPGRLAFGFPIVERIPDDLPAPRMAWLRALLIDGQDCWRLVRIGLTADGAARAEVDLSGAPNDVIETLVPIGLDSLRLVVSSLVEPAEFLVHRTESDAALKSSPLTHWRSV